MCSHTDKLLLLSIVPISCSTPPPLWKPCLPSLLSPPSPCRPPPTTLKPLSPWHKKEAVTWVPRTELAHSLPLVLCVCVRRKPMSRKGKLLPIHTEWLLIFPLTFTSTQLIYSDNKRVPPFGKWEDPAGVRGKEVCTQLRWEPASYVAAPPAGSKGGTN